MIEMNNIEEIILKNEIEKLKYLLENNRVIRKKDLSLEIEIIRIAQNYERGIYIESNKINPNSAYSIILNCALKRKSNSIIDYCSQIEKEFDEIQGRVNIKLTIINEFIEAISSVINEFDNFNINEGEQKLYGRF